MLGPVQWHALRSQRRLDVMMAAEALAPCSIAELGRAMGCRPAGLYRHVRTLAKAGLLREVGRKSVGKRWTTVYALGPFHGAAHFDAPSGRGLREHGELVLALARPAGRSYLRGVMAQRGVPQATAKRRCTAFFERTWLDATSQAEMRRLAQRMFTIVQRGRRSRGGERFQISFMMSPTGDGTLFPFSPS